MAVEVRYLVIRDGKEVGMYTTKKEADAHDKMLDIAENLFSYIEKAENIDLTENQLDELSIYLSRNRDEVIRILKGQKPPAPKTGAGEAQPEKLAQQKIKKPVKTKKKK